MSTFSEIFLAGLRKAKQRGTILVPALTSTATQTISSVDTSKTDLWTLGYTAPGATTNRGQDMLRIELTNSTTITGYRGAGSVGVAMTGGWELVEYF